MVALGLVTALLIARRPVKEYRQARALIALHGRYQETPMPDPDPVAKARRQALKVVEDDARRIATEGLYWFGQLYKILDPDCDGEREVLCRGRFKGDSKAGIPGEPDQTCFRVVVRGDHTGFVIEGW